MTTETNETVISMALTTATEARVTAVEALAKIESHERVCASRWRNVVLLLSGVFLLLIKVVLFPGLGL